MDENTKKLLIENGVDIEEALSCLGGNATLYTKLLLQFLEDNDFENLKNAIKEKNFQAALTYAHTLKGVAGNLRLKCIYEQLSEMVEDFRSGNNEGKIKIFLHIEECCNIIKNIIK